MNRLWMPLYVEDYLVDTIDLSAEEHGCYILLLMLAWRRSDAAIPNDMKYLQRALNCVHGSKFKNIVPALLGRFFELGKDGRWHNKRLTLEREKAEKLSQKQKEKSEKRWGKGEENLEKTSRKGGEKVEKREPVSKEINDLVDAAALPNNTIQDTTIPRKKDGAFAPAEGLKNQPITTPIDVVFYQRAKELLGPRLGGQIGTRIANAYDKNWSMALRLIENASDRASPIEYITRVLTNLHNPAHGIHPGL